MQVPGGRRLHGSVRVPGDKSISHRALMLAALADGLSTITGLSDGDDVRRTAAAIVALGATVVATVEEGAQTVAVRGGSFRLRAPADPIDLGNSGTGCRLLAGLVAGLDGTTVLTGDRSLSSRPMDRVAAPLERMGARVVGQGDRCLPPLSITGGALRGIDYTPPMASAQVKSAVLLAGIAAEGDTIVREPIATRAHTEEMLAAAGADITVTTHGSGRVVRVRRSHLRPTTTVVPGDPSQAAFWVVAGVIVPGSEVTVPGVHLATERTGFIDVLRRMGADIALVDADGGTGSIISRHSHLHGITVSAQEIPSLDEVPILAVAALVAQGETRFCDVGELRVKESDRLAGTVELMTTFGARATIDGDDLVVTGGAPLRPGRIDCRGDHRMAMAAAVAGSACRSSTDVTVIDGWSAVATSYPNFMADLADLADLAGSGSGEPDRRS